jgi:O-antigen ligase
MASIATPEYEATAGAIDGDRALRDFLFLATVLLLWFTTSPFQDLSDPHLLEAKDSGDLISQASAVLLTGALVAFAVFKRTVMVTRAVTLPLVATFAVFAVSALLSAYPDVAGRRLVLGGFTIFQATLLLLLPYGREHFARLLAIAAIIILAACYYGVAFLPHLSIHQASDVTEPELAGDWRGFFTHKNGAGAGMVLLIFIGLFVSRAWNRFVGIAIAAAATVFLYFTHSKSPINLLPVVLILSYVVPRVRGVVPTLALVVGVPLLIDLLTVGSVLSEPIANLVASLMSDPTFTGRDVIWSFALEKLAQRPLFGYGFEAFWSMPDLLSAWSFQESWGLRASDAHNGYLNLAVTTGLVGLAVSLVWIVLQPLADLRRACARGCDPALTTLFVQIWLFGLCLAGFESVFFGGGSALWFLMIVAIVGLRFQAIATSRG